MNPEKHPMFKRWKDPATDPQERERLARVERINLRHQLQRRHPELYPEEVDLMLLTPTDDDHGDCPF